jgi:biopolymer transport protein ExbD
MMTKFKRGRYQWLRLTAVIPVVVVIVLAFGAVAVKAETPEPKNVVEIRKGGEQILLNSKAVTLNELPVLIEQTDDRVVTIDADNDVPMGKIVDVKESLRGIERLKINYAKSEVKKADVEDVKVQTDQSEPQNKTVKARNLLSVKVSADGTLLLRGEKCSKSELKREVKRFVQNYHIYAMNTRRLHVGNLKNKEYSDFSTTALTMPNGDRVCCPVSNGIVSVTSDKDADFGDMQNVLSTIEEAYYELRQNLSRRVYNTPYDKLGPEYRQMVNNAIPTRVYMAEC